MNKNVSFVYSEDSLSLVIDNVPRFHRFRNEKEKSEIFSLLKSAEYDKILKIIDLKEYLKSESKSITDDEENIKIIDGKIFYKDEPIDPSLSNHILRMSEHGFDIDPLYAFLNNLYKNPSRRCVSELYGFLNECEMFSITPDGCFLAYKVVRLDYKDCYTGTIDNSVGQIVSMERFKVDDNKDNTCSTGLHFCSKSYIKHFSGDRVMILKINPADVVSIPVDYNNAKGRCCRYEVVGEIEKSSIEGAFYEPVQDFSEPECECDNCLEDRHDIKEEIKVYKKGLEQIEEFQQWSFDRATIKELVQVYNEMGVILGKPMIKSLFRTRTDGIRYCEKRLNQLKEFILNS